MFIQKYETETRKTVEIWPFGDGRITRICVTKGDHIHLKDGFFTRVWGPALIAWGCVGSFDLEGAKGFQVGLQQALAQAEVLDGRYPPGKEI